MKPTVMTGNQVPESTGTGGNGAPGGGAGSGINIPISREYVSGAYGSPQKQQPAPQQTHFHSGQPAYGSPRQQFQHHQPIPHNPNQQHFQSTFGFEPDMDMDMDNMFPRSRLGRMHDPFVGFGDSHFGFPQFSTGRRGRMPGGASNHMEHDDDFFNRLPSEFRQYIPDGFGARRGTGAAATAGSGQSPQQQHPQQYQYVPLQQQHPTQPMYNVAQQQVPQSPSKHLCDAAIQTEDLTGRSEVDCPAAAPATLHQHGLRNTVDMGVKSAAEQDQNARCHSAPPPEQQHQNLLHQQQQQQRPNPPQQQFATQTSPPISGQYPAHQQPQLKSFYAPQQQTQAQQKQQSPTPAPETPGGGCVRTIPIFVEGRSEPIINAHKEIPNQFDSSNGQATGQSETQFNFTPQQQHRPTPFNTQQHHNHTNQQPPMEGPTGLPPQTPHTLDSINKIQDIQRDVLELMTKVEQFKGTRVDKDYVYLDEMLTRNLLKLDTIDTNGKDSIRLARKEAIKCIQASINVLEAKAEENARAVSGAASVEATANKLVTSDVAAAGDAAVQVSEPVTPHDAIKPQDPIPLPAPPNAGLVETPSAPDTSKEQLDNSVATSADAVGDSNEMIGKTTTSTSE